MQQQQRLPKYGSTDVNSRTVHNLLNTINAMSSRLKTLELYEHTLLEIYKAILVIRPSAKMENFDPHALPALVLNFLSKFIKQNTNGTMTHNINYTYAYNYPQPFPGPSFGSQFSSSQQPPPPPQFSTFTPPSPPFSQSPPSAPQPPSSFLQEKIELTTEQNEQLTSIFFNSNDVQKLIDYLIFLKDILKVHFVFNDKLFNAIELIKIQLKNTDISLLINCIFKKTNIQFIKNEFFCYFISEFLIFFKNIFILINQIEFNYTLVDDDSYNNLRNICNELYNKIKQKFESPQSDENFASLTSQLKKERSNLTELNTKYEQLLKDFNTIKTNYQSLKETIENDDKTLTLTNEIFEKDEIIKTLTNEIFEKDQIIKTLQQTEKDQTFETLQNEFMIDETTNELILNNENQSLKSQIKDLLNILEITFSSIKDYYKVLWQIISDYFQNSKEFLELPTYEETPENIDFESAKNLVDQQHRSISKWFDFLNRELFKNSNFLKEDQLNSEMLNQYKNLKESIFELVSKKENLISDVNISDETLIEKITDIIKNEKKTTKENVELKTKIKDLENLRNDLFETRESLKTLINLTDNEPQLNNTGYQAIKEENDRYKAKNKILENLQTTAINDICEKVLKSKIEELNTIVDNTTNLFVKYQTQVNDIFDEQSNLFENYESLARTVAATTTEPME
ncbi:desmoplakin [Oxyplax ochracea nucleopolyhedrovirus]|uniref:Desmoplakin n=1 Tax=Oxyplax ochracea nucleopolyhedrovirus TaxID=2083176 RepID=A0A2L0WU50_9ABAC|nr:desmoplakin [Oxyplax ochracea nucleopolyhedrovirus]AVA31170.1 desmoplakin [Oxyplax ochracea nucleopolyhedrovirus]